MRSAPRCSTPCGRPTDFFNQIKGSSLQVIGLSFATLIHNEGWWFTQVGRLLERADKTSRIIDCRTHTLPVRGLPESINQATALEWSSVLQSCITFEIAEPHHELLVHSEALFAMHPQLALGLEARPAAMARLKDAFLVGQAYAAGWQPLDPTHNCIPGKDYVKIGVGRDNADVPPVSGTYNGTTERTMHVIV